MKTKILQMGADNFGAGGRSVIAYNLTRPLTDDFQVDFLAIGKLKNPSFHRIIEENGGQVQHVKEASSKIKRLRNIYSILKKKSTILFILTQMMLSRAYLILFCQSL